MAIIIVRKGKDRKFDSLSGRKMAELGHKVKPA